MARICFAFFMGTPFFERCSNVECVIGNVVPDAGIPAKYFVTIITEMIPRVNRKRKTLKKVLENHNNFVIIGKVLDAHYIE